VARLRPRPNHNSTPSTRRLLDGVAVRVAHRSTEPARLRQVSLLYRDCVNRAKEELDEMDEAQRLVDEQSVRKEGSVKRSWSRASVDDAPAEESSPAPVDL
jgi:hypothetical protein